MKSAPIHRSEPERLAELQRYRILDTAPEAEFDDLTQLAAQICGTPIALISLLDTGRQWFKSRVGLDATETPRDISFCGHAIHGREVFEVTHAQQDERFFDNPLVTGDPHIQFYAGAPLLTAQGHALGTLCVIDKAPHILSPAQKTALATLGRQVVRQLDLRLLISREQELNQALSRQARFQQVLLDSAVAAVISTSADGVVTSFNLAAERLLGYSAGEVVGKRVMTTFHIKEELQARARELRLELGRAVSLSESLVARPRLGQPETREWHYRRKNDTLVPVSVSVAALDHEEGGQRDSAGFVVLAWDITERQQAERLKAEFVSTVSHELRTPLTSISGALGLLCGGALGPVTPQVQAMLDIAYKNSRRLSHLINDLLDMEKLVAGKMHFDLHTHDIMALVDQSIESIKSYAQPFGVAVLLCERVQGVRVHVDASRLQQVLGNLLSNAVKFSPQAGQVEVIVCPDWSRGQVRVEVTDHGAGIPAEFSERVFQKFSQADGSDTRQKGGSGLGLAISKEIIERMDGSIGFTSVPGQGATFYFELPVWMDAPSGFGELG